MTLPAGEILTDEPHTVCPFESFILTTLNECNDFQGCVVISTNDANGQQTTDTDDQHKISRPTCYNSLGHFVYNWRNVQDQGKLIV